MAGVVSWEEARATLAHDPAAACKQLARAWRARQYKLAEQRARKRRERAIGMGAIQTLLVRLRAGADVCTQYYGFIALASLIAERGSDASKRRQRKQARNQLQAYRNGAVPLLLDALSAELKTFSDVLDVHSAAWLALAAMLTHSGGHGLVHSSELTCADRHAILRAAVASLPRSEDAEQSCYDLCDFDDDYCWIDSTEIKTSNWHLALSEAFVNLVVSSDECGRVARGALHDSRALDVLRRKATGYTFGVGFAESRGMKQSSAQRNLGPLLGLSVQTREYLEYDGYYDEDEYNDDHEDDDEEDQDGADIRMPDLFKGHPSFIYRERFDHSVLFLEYFHSGMPEGAEVDPMWYGEFTEPFEKWSMIREGWWTPERHAKCAPETRVRVRFLMLMANRIAAEMQLCNAGALREIWIGLIVPRALEFDTTYFALTGTPWPRSRPSLRSSCFDHDERIYFETAPH